MPARPQNDPLTAFAEPVREWFIQSFESPTEAQARGWPAISRGEHTLILAPTGSGKTLTAFLWAINRLMFSPEPEKSARCRVLYISPIKALAVDVERNLQSPLTGISRVAAISGSGYRIPTIAVRTGDTPQADRARFRRAPDDILITTPESLYLLLTSGAREALQSVETVIIDEIHALVPTKRGAHLALSLARLDAITRGPVQRIGLSATQRPLDEVARFLGGATRTEDTPLPVDSASEEPDSSRAVRWAAVTVVDTGERKKLSLSVRVPVEDMTDVGATVDIPSGSAAQNVVRTSIWPAIHPQLVDLIRSHRTTLIFVNSRRLAERLSAALNELAGEVLVQAHHGSLARAQRAKIEDLLKSGRLPALVATSSLELGIDMGAVDLVVQIEAPPSIASGMQRIGRASHQVGAVSKGIIFPKFRGDLVACAAVSHAMKHAHIEATRFPRNPLDVLAQHVVAAVAMDDWHVEELLGTVRLAAPFAEISSNVFSGLLDMLSGVYPSDDFAELRPRLTWDRTRNILTARQGAKRVAITNGGTIPDRGLYGVYLAGREGPGARVGELDEEMVFEASEGETFLLGASTWRIEEITFDRVIVSPAPGEPGKMPFWHGDSADRPAEFGGRIGRLVRAIASLPPAAAIEQLRAQHDLDEMAAANLVAYVREQREATHATPDDRTIVVERCRDELGDWRVCVLSPWGGRVHAPWALAVVARVREERSLDVEVMWSDDGFVVRFPETDEPPDASLVLPGPEEVEQSVIRQLGSSSLFAAKFRENASRALLLPKRRPGQRAPLWQQRKRASDLLAVAARYGSFPIMLETYRECLRDVFDLPALQDILRKLERREIRSVVVDTEQPSPFASSLLFRYVANYLYDGDAPLAERRAAALAIDQSQLRELLGDLELRDMLDASAIEEVEHQLQQLDVRFRARSADGIHDMLLRIGDLTREEIEQRFASHESAPLVDELIRDRRALEVRVAGENRLIAIEDSARYRDALGVALPTGVPDRFLLRVPDALRGLIQRWSRTHGPFLTAEVAARFGIGGGGAEEVLRLLGSEDRVMEGEFRPGGTHREWCDSEVLRQIRRRSLARLRKEIAPVDPAALGRLLPAWQGLGRSRRGPHAILDAVETLQGAAIPASILENAVLPARVEGYRESDLDALISAGEIVWVGLEPIGERDGRVALYLTESLPFLVPIESSRELTADEEKLVELLRTRGASFFPQLVTATEGFPADMLDILWSLVWKGLVTNDSLQPLRSKVRPARKGSARRGVVSRRQMTPGSEGRWSLVESMFVARPSRTEQTAAQARQLLARYGVVTREALQGEILPGGFQRVYAVLRAMEEAGQVRRGYFISDVGATQFALPGAVDLLRSSLPDPEKPLADMLAAADPANAWGSVLRWPREEGRTLQRVSGAWVVLVDGSLAAYLRRGESQLLTFIPSDEPRQSQWIGAVATLIAQHAQAKGRRAMLLAEIDGAPASDHPLAEPLLRNGFVRTSQGLHFRSAQTAKAVAIPEDLAEEDEDDA